MKLATLGFLLLIVAKAYSVEPIPLRAGPMTMVFDAENASLRYLRVGSNEVLRGINAPIRDSNWATIEPLVANVQIDDRGHSFQVRFEVTCRQAEIDFRWKGTISGSETGVVEFSFAGEAHSTFQRNRIGFCVLHPATAAGHAWTLETVDGKKSDGQFPTFISPHQPAKNLRAITHQVAPGLRARVQLDGDLFEMEDQRNWTDASFKTYCTPLELPYPVEVAAGTKIAQQITVSLDSDPSADIRTLPPAAEPLDGVALTLSEHQTALPRLGLQVSSEVEQLTTSQIERLKALHLDHLRVDLNISNESFDDILRRATHQARSLGVSLQIGLSLGMSPDFATLLKEIAELRPPVSYWLVAGSDPADYQTARKHLAEVMSGAKIGVTQLTNFVDLNRARPADDSIQAIGFAINPQVHAFDNGSMMETLPIHADVIHSARRFAGERPLLIGPITLAPQLVYGEDQPGGPPAGGPLPTYVDVRQVEPFAAAWTLGSLTFLATAETPSVTYFETIGWNGVIDADDLSSRPAAFPSKPGETFPLYHLFHELAPFADGQVQSVHSSSEADVIGLALHKAGRTRVLVGNLSSKNQRVTLSGLRAEGTTIRMLGEEEAKSVPSELDIHLPPYGIAILDRMGN